MCCVIVSAIAHRSLLGFVYFASHTLRASAEVEFPESHCLHKTFLRI